MTQIQSVLKTIRPPFLILTPVCVFLGLSTALVSDTPVNVSTFVLIFIGAISAHISVNMLNEYYDFTSGLDLKTNRTPFSGGTGALPDNPGAASAVLLMGLISLAITIGVGLYLVWEHGTQILPIGLAGVILIITYTHWINRMPLVCLVSPGMGFGILMVIGTHMILSGTYSSLPLLVSLIPFFLVNNLLLLNQYPDVEADRSVGRKTFPIAFGLEKSNWIYALFAVLTYALIVLMVLKNVLPGLSLIAVIPFALSLFAFSGAYKYGLKIGEHPRYLGANVAATILTPLLLGISIISGS